MKEESPSHHILPRLIMAPTHPQNHLFVLLLKLIPDFHVEGVGGVKEELDDVEEVVLNQEVDRKQPLVVLTIQIAVLLRVTEEGSVHQVPEEVSNHPLQAEEAGEVEGGSPILILAIHIKI